MTAFYEAIKDANVRGSYLAAIRNRGKDVLIKDLESAIEMMIEALGENQKLVAENAALKGLIEMHAGGFAVCPNCSHEDPSETDDIVALYRSTETPTTEAAIAEFKAQGADTVAEHHRVRADALCDVDTKGMYRHQLAYLDANDVAANLRAGRKG